MVMAFVNRNTKELLVSLSYADEKDIEFSGNCLNVEYDAVKLTDEEFKNSVVEKGGKKYLVRGCYSKKIT